MGTLHGRVALVAGATRGAGRAIACTLGEAGATVYCTGRSVRGTPATKGRAETIEETAELVTAAGGEGIWVRVDHTVEDQVVELFARIAQEQGHLDILVNDIWGGDELTEWGTPFWKHSLSKGLLMLDRAVTAHIITSRYGAPLLVDQKKGLIVEVTDGHTLAYRGNLYYDQAKISAIRLAYAMAWDLKGTGVTAVAITPGFLRSEAVLEHFGVTEKNWRDAIPKDKHFAESETPYFVGRAIAALAADPDVDAKAGQVLTSGTLGEEYGFDDVDGRRPNWVRHFDGMVTELIERGAPFDPIERLFLDQRCSQADFDPFKREEAARIRSLMKPDTEAAP